MYINELQNLPRDASMQTRLAHLMPWEITTISGSLTLFRIDTFVICDTRSKAYGVYKGC